LRRALSLRQPFGCDRGIAAVGRFAMRAHGPGVICTRPQRVQKFRGLTFTGLILGLGYAIDSPHLDRHRRKLMAVVPLINHLVGNDQMVLRINGDLYIVADGGGC
jgi:hypothetical protein